MGRYKYYLMNKNTIVLTIDFNSFFNMIDVEINNIDYAPLSIYRTY